jgi:hypothetical protein
MIRHKYDKYSLYYAIKYTNKKMIIDYDYLNNYIKYNENSGDKLTYLELKKKCQYEFYLSGYDTNIENYEIHLQILFAVMGKEQLIKYANEVNSAGKPPLYSAFFYNMYNIWEILWPITDQKLLYDSHLISVLLDKCNDTPTHKKIFKFLILNTNFMQWNIPIYYYSSLTSTYIPIPLKPLMRACERIDIPAIKILLKKYDNINIRNIRGNDALYFIKTNITAQYIFIINFIRGYQLKYKYIFLCKNILRR